MDSHLSRQYHFGVYRTLFYVPSNALVFNGDYTLFARYVWWWPVNWLVYPYSVIARLVGIVSKKTRSFLIVFVPRPRVSCERKLEMNILEKAYREGFADAVRSQNNKEACDIAYRLSYTKRYSDYEKNYFAKCPHCQTVFKDQNMNNYVGIVQCGNCDHLVDQSVKLINPIIIPEK